jgi:hypothetical protein
MKLIEIKKRTLQEAMGLKWVFNISESLETRFDDEAWSQVGDKQVGQGYLGDEEFEVYLEPGTFTIDDFEYSLINASFAKIIDGKPSEELTLTGKSASKIVGAVANALVDRVQLYGMDAVIFFANDNVEDRMRVYNKVAERKWTRLGFGTAIYNIDMGDERKMTLLVDKDLSKQRLDAFIEHLKKLKKR